MQPFYCSVRRERKSKTNPKFYIHILAECRDNLQKQLKLAKYVLCEAVPLVWTEEDKIKGERLTQQAFADK